MVTVTATSFLADVLALSGVGVKLHLIHDDSLQVAHDLHCGDGDKHVILFRGILVQLNNGAAVIS